MKRNKKSFNSISLRSILYSVIAILAVVLIGGFYLVHSSLSEKATEVSLVVSQYESIAASKQVVDLDQLEAELELHRDVNDSILKLYVPSTSLQTQTIKDINLYAKNTSLSVENIKFGPTSNRSDLQPNDVTLTLRNPVSYSSLLRFMQLIETNLPKMNLHGINLNAVENGRMVNVGDIIIGVSMR